MKLFSDRTFKEVYNQKLLGRLEKRFGAFQRHHVDLTISSEVMLDMARKMRDKSRRGEVVMVIPNEQRHLWLHTKTFYPPEVYRLMTGGVDLGEKPDEAFLREVAEETGFKVVIDRCLAVITYCLTIDKETLPFVSYIFTAMPTPGTPHPNDPREAIAHFQAIPVESLPIVAQRLRSVSGPFSDWGVFRAAAHEVAYAQLRNRA